MDVFEAIIHRRSIRDFRPDQVSAELLNKLLEAAIWAPSAGNLQARELIVVTTPDLKKKVCNAAFSQRFIEKAPIVLIVCANEERSAQRYGERGKQLFCVQDATASIQNILLAAHSLGLGACWVGAFDEQNVQKTLNLPNNVKPIAIISLGYPAEFPSAPPRRRLDDWIHYNHY